MADADPTPAARELLARILDGWDAGRDNDHILTPDTVHEIRVALARTDELETRVAALEGALQRMVGIVDVLPGLYPRMLNAADDARELLAPAAEGDPA